MKKMKKLAALAFALVLIFSLCASVFAEDTTQYTVRLYGGDSSVGVLKVGDGTVYSQSVQTGKTVTFTEDMVEVKDERLYPKGFREAGHDNSPLITFGTTVTVTRDIDFVIAYGMKSTAVKYTVRYVHATTNADLIGAQTFYGNVGDKPVVAFLYIENFMPQAYNLTKTLSETESENVFIFRYEPIPATAVNQVNNQAVPADNNANANANANAGNNANANAGNNAGTNAGTGTGENGGAGTNAGTGTGENGGAGTNAGTGTGENGGASTNAGTGTGENGGAGTENNAPLTPEEIIDLDVPLAGPGQNGDGESGNGSSSSSHMGVYAIIGVILLGLLAALALLLKKKKDLQKDAKETKETEDQ